MNNDQINQFQKNFSQLNQAQVNTFITYLHNQQQMAQVFIPDDGFTLAELSRISSTLKNINPNIVQAAFNTIIDEEIKKTETSEIPKKTENLEIPPKNAEPELTKEELKILEDINDSYIKLEEIKNKFKVATTNEEREELKKNADEIREKIANLKNAKWKKLKARIEALSAKAGKINLEQGTFVFSSRSYASISKMYNNYKKSESVESITTDHLEPKPESKYRLADEYNEMYNMFGSHHEESAKRSEQILEDLKGNLSRKSFKTLLKNYDIKIVSGNPVNIPVQLLQNLSTYGIENNINNLISKPKIQQKSESKYRLADEYNEMYSTFGSRHEESTKRSEQILEDLKGTLSRKNFKTLLKNYDIKFVSGNPVNIPRRLLQNLSTYGIDGNINNLISEPRLR